MELSGVKTQQIHKSEQSIKSYTVPCQVTIFVHWYQAPTVTVYELCVSVWPSGKTSDPPASVAYSDRGVTGAP
jgi:hypothetical protein